MLKKSCKKGYYYCYASKKCKKIPKGWYVMSTGYLMRDENHDKEEESKKKKNGNDANGDGNGSGNSSGSSDGGGVSEGWSVKYKKSIDCNNPKGFSQKAHCKGRKKVTEEKERDHEVSMAQSQLKKSARNIAKLRKALGKKEKNIPAWVQAKITDTEHNTDAAAGYMDEGKRDGKSAKDKDYSLRDWFKGGGWVQAGGKYDGKPCARQPGQKTKPFCRDADDRASMTKNERERRAKKKRREDPNPTREGKAKMVMDCYSNWRVELDQLDEGIPALLGGAALVGGAAYLINKAKEAASKKNYDEKSIGKPTIQGVASGLRKKSDILKKLRNESAENIEEKKDACYHKVKSRYKVWPSAYASGALVKCRKVGAKNWGNKTKNEGYEFSNWRDDFKALEIETVNIIENQPLKSTDIKEDWQSVNRKDKIDGMSQKAVDAYRRENPGSKLKTAVTEKNPSRGRSKRRKSFCARSKGQKDMHNIDCTKTPEKKICKARKRWRC